MYAEKIFRKEVEQMNLGLSGEGLGHLFLLGVFVGVAAILCIGFLADKLGIDIFKHRFALTLGLGCGIIFGIIPLWLLDLTIKQKIIVSFFGLAGGIGNYFVIGRMQRILYEKYEKKKEK